MFAAIGSDPSPRPGPSRWPLPAASVRAVKLSSPRRWRLGRRDPWLMCLEGGDAERGRAIFTGKSETACAATWWAKRAGPSRPALDGVGARLSREESSGRSSSRTNRSRVREWLTLDDGEV